jgi:hypothetical protein
MARNAAVDVNAIVHDPLSQTCIVKALNPDQLRRSAALPAKAGRQQDVRVTTASFLDWLHIGMGLQHLKQIARGLSCDDPSRGAAKAVIVAEVDWLHWRLWNGKAANARISIDRIRAVMHQVVDRLARVGRLFDRSERVAGQLRRASPSRIETWHRNHRRDGQFPGEPSDEQIAADAMAATRGRSAASGSLRCL